MKYCWLLIMVAIIFTTHLAWAATPETAMAGKYSIELSSQPSPPVVGENLLVITVKAGNQPVSNSAVDVHIDMTSMSMPADSKAAPGAKPGEYGATVNFAMAGAWKVDIAVQQMPGMAMAGDGTAHFFINTGKGIVSKGNGPAIPWSGILVVLLILATLLTIIFYRHIPAKQRGYLVGTLTLLIVLVGTIVIVEKYRDTKTSTVLASANMNMSTQAAPGTVAVTTDIVTETPFQASVTYTGTVAPDQEEDVFPRITGRLVFMPFYPGDHIAKGQVVARLDTAELAAKEAQALYGSQSASQGISAANADISTAQAGQAKALRVVDQAQAQLQQVQSAARGAESAVKAAQSEVTAARQMSQEADSAVLSAQAGVKQANEAVLQAQSDVESTQADVAYWTAEIAREKKLYAQGAIAKEEYDRETAQSVAANAKVNQMKAAVRTAQAGVTRAKQEVVQAQARQAAAQAAIATSEARVEQSQADRDSARQKISEAQAGIQTALADVRAAASSVTGAAAKARMASASSRQAHAQLTEASTVKGYTEIRASSGGVVTARNVAPGTLVQPGMAIMKIAKTDVVRIQVNVSAGDLAQISIGQTISAHTIDAPDQPFSARISAVFPTQDPSARTAIVEARVPNVDGRLRPGQYLSVDLALGKNQHPTLSVPTTALNTRDGQSSVFMMVNDGVRTTAKRVLVTTGRVSNTRTEILSGLQVGDQVITSGQANLHDGDAATVLRPNENSTPPSGDNMAPSMPMKMKNTN